MNTFLTFLHVAAAIILLGPVVVATSMFPSEAVKARAGAEESVGRASVLHKITKNYGLLSLLVPLLGGVVMAFDWDLYHTNYWLHTAIILSAIAWGILYFMVIPQQRRIMGSLGALDPADADPADRTANFEKSKAQASAGAGIFNLMWVLVLGLMFLPAPSSATEPAPAPAPATSVTDTATSVTGTPSSTTTVATETTTAATVTTTN